jgi:hypothetical protein
MLSKSAAHISVPTVAFMSACSGAIQCLVQNFVAKFWRVSMMRVLPGTGRCWSTH